jgi:Glycosyl hydrolase family 65, N-terminal domain
LTLAAENWSGPITVRSGTDGRVVNAFAKLYKNFNGKHLDPLAGEVVGDDSVYSLARTRQSDIRVAQVARSQVLLGGRLVDAA